MASQILAIVLFGVLIFGGAVGCLLKAAIRQRKTKGKSHKEETFTLRNSY